MLHLFQRHPFAVKAWFKRSLVLTYAFPREVLAPLLPPGLELDCFGDVGFAAVALVQTEKLRPAFMPGWLGQGFFLAGYRVFARYQTAAGRRLRGLRILRSDTDRRLMASVGNLLTHYRYQIADVESREAIGQWHITVRTPGAEANLDLSAVLEKASASLPACSPFPDERRARLFAGPLPFTFDYEPETHSI